MFPKFCGSFLFTSHVLLNLLTKILLLRFTRKLRCYAFAFTNALSVRWKILPAYAFSQTLLVVHLNISLFSSYSILEANQWPHDVIFFPEERKSLYKATVYSDTSNTAKEGTSGLNLVSVHMVVMSRYWPSKHLLTKIKTCYCTS